MMRSRQQHKEHCRSCRLKIPTWLPSSVWTFRNNGMSASMCRDICLQRAVREAGDENHHVSYLFFSSRLISYLTSLPLAAYPVHFCSLFFSSISIPPLSIQSTLLPHLLFLVFILLLLFSFLLQLLAWINGF